MIPVSERFARHWSENPTNGCHEWHGAKDGHGYGQLRCDGKNRLSTHISLELSGHPRPSPLHCALHRCDNPACVNPDHLWWGLRKENTQDAIAKGRLNTDGLAYGRTLGTDAAARRNRAKTHCKRGHELTGRNLLPRKDGLRQCRDCRNIRRRKVPA